MNAWHDTISVLLGVGIGGLITIFGAKVQFERERKWQRDRLLQEKLLEIAKLTEDIQEKFCKLYADAISAVEGGQKLQPGSDPIPLVRIKILISFYAPELRPHIEQIIKIRDEVGTSVADVLLPRVRSQTERQQLNLRFVLGMKRIGDECDNLAKAAAQSAQHRLGIAIG